MRSSAKISKGESNLSPTSEIREWLWHIDNAHTFIRLTNAPNGPCTNRSRTTKELEDVLPEKEPLQTSAQPDGVVHGAKMSPLSYVFSLRANQKESIAWLGLPAFRRPERRQVCVLQHHVIQLSIHHTYDVASKKSTVFRSDIPGFNLRTTRPSKFYASKAKSADVPGLQKGLKLDATIQRYFMDTAASTSSAPNFSSLRLALLEQGVVYASRICGGGEYGEKWHEAGTD